VPHWVALHAEQPHPQDGGVLRFRLLRTRRSRKNAAAPTIRITMTVCKESMVCTCQKPNSRPPWKTTVARTKASTVLKAMEKAPHFQCPDSRTMQITETKQGA
jgi:hypothetical protein